MKADYAAYEGKTVIGAPDKVFSRGELVVDGNRTLAKKGRGQFLRRGTFAL